MKINLKHNQKMENLIFSVKDLSDTYDREIDSESLFYLIQDLNIACGQNNHNNIVIALNGLKSVISSHEKLFNEIRKIDNMIE